MQFLSIARGSLSELETQVLLATDLGYLEENRDLLKRIERIFALLGGLMNNLGRKK
jgi:four helix bundle protein